MMRRRDGLAIGKSPDRGASHAALFDHLSAANVSIAKNEQQLPCIVAPVEAHVVVGVNSVRPDRKAPAPINGAVGVITDLSGRDQIPPTSESVRLSQTFEEILLR